MTKTKTQVKYKDTVFRMIFKEKKHLLSLYNALNGTDYTNVDDLEIKTIDNAVYMTYKNDISFVFDFELMLYEHQSTVNPNMPLRDLFYVTEVIQGIVSKENIYSSKLIKLPAPRFVVFYNGMSPQPERQILKLSDAYLKKQETLELELTVTVLNVNFGHNKELMEACRLLREYAEFVQKVRDFAKQMTIEEAVAKAVDYCIENNILKDFLIKNRAEAIRMSIFEYNEEEHIKGEREIAYKDGWEGGRAEGEEIGISIGINALIQDNLDANNSKAQIVEKLTRLFQIDTFEAEAYYDKYVR